VLLLIVLGVVVLLALVVLGALGYALLGAVGRLTREMTALQRDVGRRHGQPAAPVRRVAS